MTEKFKVQFLEDAADFLDNLDEKARDKIIYNIYKAQRTNDKELFRKLTGEIWEFRTLFNKTYYRLFAFFGTKLIRLTPSLFQLTDLSKRLAKLLKAISTK